MLAICEARLLKSSRVETELPSTLTRPGQVSIVPFSRITFRRTIIVRLLEVHVDNTTGPHVVHIWAIERLDFSEFTGLNLVATVLRKEDWDVPLCELLGADIVAGLRDAGVTAPGIDVVAPEVDCVRAIAAVKITRQVLADVSVVIGGISDTNGPIVLLLDIGLHVTGGSLNKGASIGVGIVVRDFVAGKEAKGVGILCHDIDNGCVASIEIVVPVGVVADDGVARCREIRNDIDASGGQGVHAIIMVLIRVNSVDTDSVGAKLGEIRNISLAVGRVT